MSKIITKFIRGNKTESFHESKCLIINSKEKIIFSTNHNHDYIFPRSSIKIFQAIPFASSSAIRKYDLSNKQIALSCSSHNGEKYHIEELNNWLRKIKLKKSNLKCGIHNSLDKASADKLLLSGIKPNELHNNCAGKHLAMLSSAMSNNYNLSEYLNFNHPQQIKIRKIFELFSESKIYKKNYGVDGCSAPQYAIKIKDICKSLINLVKSYNFQFLKEKEVRLLLSAIMDNPYFIGGRNNLDSNLIKISNKKLFCKGGAEGVFLFAHLENKIVGLIKVKDGNQRAISSILEKLFRRFKILNNHQLKKLKYWNTDKLINHANINIGKIITEITY